MSTQNNLTVPELLGKLNELYDKEDELKKKIKLVQAEWNQLQEDKELLQLMIMHQSNKVKRVNTWKTEQKH